MEGCRLRVLNWEKFQGDAKRYKSTSWHRIENTIWMHPLWDELDDSEYRAFSFLLCYVSQRAHKTAEVELNFKTIERLSRVKPAALASTVRKLCALGMAEIIESPAPGTHGECTVNEQGTHSEETGAHCSTNTTKITNIKAPHGAPVFNFLDLYKRYPEKKGKTDGLLECEKQIKTPEQYAELERAVQAYAAYHNRPLAEGEFRPNPKHFDTWMRKGRWRECLDPGWDGKANSSEGKFTWD
jgi:hypothetical protein